MTDIEQLLSVTLPHTVVSAVNTDRLTATEMPRQVWDSF